MKSKIIFLSLAAVALFAAGCNKDVSQQNNSSLIEKNSLDSNQGMQNKDVAISNAGVYGDYSTQAVADAQKAGQKVVLFFHASWCPYCKAADAAFKANLDKIPSGVAVLKTDYDTQSQLKQKYGVTYQHTFVQIDVAGNMLTKWVSGDIELLKQNIK